jgi:hypothetical protein
VSFQQFLKAIRSPRLASVARHWDEARRGKRMPAWGDIKPSLIKAQLPIIWSWRFDDASGQFVGRLAGNEIELAFGRSFRNRPMSDIFREHDYEKFLARHTRVMREPALFIGRGLVFNHLKRLDVGERIVMPLAADGVIGDGILGATDAKTQVGQVNEELIRRGEEESWFALEP